MVLSIYNHNQIIYTFYKNKVKRRPIQQRQCKLQQEKNMPRKDTYKDILDTTNVIKPKTIPTSLYVQ